MGSKTVKITKPPTKACAPKKPTYSDGKFGAAWSFKGHLESNKKAADRAEYFAIKWYFVRGGVKKSKAKKLVRSKSKIKVGKKGTDSFSIKRKKYYPYFKTKANASKNQSATQYKTRIKSAYYVVWARNSAKATKTAPLPPLRKKTSPVYKFTKPDAPKIGSVSFDQFSRKWSCGVVAAENKPPKDRVYTYYNKWHKYSWEKPKKDKKGQLTRQWISDTTAGNYNLAGQYVPFSQDSLSVTGTIPNTFDTIGYDGWAMVLVKAYSQGMAGNSAKTPSKYRVFSYPDQVAVKSVTTKFTDTNYVWDSTQKKFVKASSTGVTNGTIIVNVDLVQAIQTEDGQNLHPIDSMTLQVLRNTTISDPLEASLSNQWDDVDSGNSSTRAFTDSYDLSRPDAEKIVWYRVVTVHDHLERYSMPYRATGLEWSMGKASLIDAIVVDDGVNPTGIKVIYGYNADHMDGTQIEWSSHKNAFNSNNPPSSAVHDRSDANVNSKSETEKICKQYGVKYNYTSIFYITGLDEGENYYISARRYYHADNGDVYGKRQWFMRDEKIAAVSYARKPEDVTMTVPTVLTSLSDGAEISWNFSASVKQKEYTVYYVQAQKDANGNVIYQDGSDKQAVTIEKALKTEKTEKMFTKLTEGQLQTALQDGSITLRVGVSCGGPESKSSNTVISVTSAPEMSVRIDTETEGAKFVRTDNNVTLTAQGGSIFYQVDQTNTNVFVSVIASGKAVDTPDGGVLQMEGDVLYTGVLTDVLPDTWNSFILPDCEFFDVAGYSIRFTPVSRTTGLRGSTRELTFTVEWAHQAQPPSETSYVLGDHIGQTATIYPFQPEPDAYAEGDGFSENDVCDVYRLTPDGAYLIATGVSFGNSVTDPFAPFSNHTPLQYRLVTRTLDGDFNWTDVTYSVRGYSIRFDWFTVTGQQRTLSLPYNLVYSDKWSKQFEGVRDLSGGKTGWWLPGVDRTASLSTDMVRLDAFDDQVMVRELANHAGCIFVRTPNGCAYAANVNVTEFPNSYDSLVSNVKFEAEEIDLVPEFTIQAETL